MIERGETWLTDFDPVLPGEQGGVRPAIIVSSNSVNRWQVGLVVVVPVTTRQRGFAHHIPIVGGGLDHASWAMPEYVRSVSQRRLRHQLGLVDEVSMAALADWLRRMVGL